MKVHSDEKQFECGKCGRKFRHKNSLVLRLLSVMRYTGAVCRFATCGSTSPASRSSADGAALSTALLYYNSALLSRCAKQFVSRARLRRHEAVHAREEGGAPCLLSLPAREEGGAAGSGQLEPSSLPVSQPCSFLIYDVIELIEL